MYRRQENCRVEEMAKLRVEEFQTEPKKEKLELEEDPELEAIKARMRELEEEVEKLKELQNEVEKQMSLSRPAVVPVVLSMEEKMEADSRSIYVGNVDYGATPEELQAHFHKYF